MPICEQINLVVTGAERPVDAYRGLVPSPGHEAEPG
jgi:hypothetical protein